MHLMAKPDQAFLEAALGEAGAKALGRAFRVPEVKAAIGPRAVLAWVSLASRVGYRGEVPGIPGSRLTLRKSDAGWSGSLQVKPDELECAWDSGSLFRAAAVVSSALGMPVDTVPPVAPLARLGRAVDVLAKREFVKQLKLVKAEERPLLAPEKPDWGSQEVFHDPEFNRNVTIMHTSAGPHGNGPRPGYVEAIHVDEQHPEKRVWAVTVRDGLDGTPRLFARMAPHRNKVVGDSHSGPVPPSESRASGNDDNWHEMKGSEQGHPLESEMEHAVTQQRRWEKNAHQFGNGWSPTVGRQGWDMGSISPNIIDHGVYVGGTRILFVPFQHKPEEPER